MDVWPKKWTCTAKRHGLKFRLHQRIVFEDDRKRHDCYTPTIFKTKPDSKRFSEKFVQSVEDIRKAGINDISNSPWIAIFVKKLKKCRRVPKYVMEWITDYEGKSGTGAKWTGSKQTKQTWEVEEEVSAWESNRSEWINVQSDQHSVWTAFNLKSVLIRGVDVAL